MNLIEHPISLDITYFFLTPPPHHHHPVVRGGRRRLIRAGGKVSHLRNQTWRASNECRAINNAVDRRVSGPSSGSRGEKLICSGKKQVNAGLSERGGLRQVMTRTFSTPEKNCTDNLLSTKTNYLLVNLMNRLSSTHGAVNFSSLDPFTANQQCMLCLSLFLLSSLRSSFVELAYPPGAIPSLRESPSRRLSGFRTRTNWLHSSDITSGWRKINIHRFMTV